MVDYYSNIHTHIIIQNEMYICRDQIVPPLQSQLATSNIHCREGRRIQG